MHVFYFLNDSNSCLDCNSGSSTEKSRRSKWIMIKWNDLATIVPTEQTELDFSYHKAGQTLRTRRFEPSFKPEVISAEKGHSNDLFKWKELKATTVTKKKIRRRVKLASRPQEARSSIIMINPVCKLVEAQFYWEFCANFRSIVRGFKVENVAYFSITISSDYQRCFCLFVCLFFVIDLKDLIVIPQMQALFLK